MVDFSKISQYNGDMRKLKGFTLIEVILVLAVAGLIMAMVFVGVPALTATQRDSSRKDQMLQFISNLKSYQANNNRGSLPLSGGGEMTVDGELIKGEEVTFSLGDGVTWKDFYGGYLGENFVDPNGEKYDLLVMDCDANVVGSNCANNVLDDPEFYTIYVVKNATCKGIDVVYSANPKSVAILHKMERSDRYCANT